MKFTFNTKNCRLSDADHDMIVKKMNRLEKFFRSDAEVTITIKQYKIKDTVEVTIHSDNLIFRAEKSASDVISSVDEICEALERQLHKNKTKLEKRIREGAFLIADVKDEIYNNDVSVSEEEYDVIRTKIIQIKPMTVDEAILQMNLLEHEFFMFFNHDTNSTCVVYKRKNGGYGLLEPEI